ncbi:MAG: ATP-dependent hydrolase [Rhizobium sp. 60-20]|nr:AAA family ATPase [Rhizobium tropici]OJY79698.1 MAG: ATP-dependent hydrolase [Rhizobium sp. 60-20]
MKHRITAEAFKVLKRNLGVFLSTCSLRATLRPFCQFKRNTRGILVVIVDKRWIRRYERAAELLITGERRVLFQRDVSRRLVHVIEPSSRQRHDDWIDTLGAHHQLIVLATSFELVPENVRRAADVIIDVQPPTARHIAAGRRLAGLPSLPRDMLRKLAQQDMRTIESLAARQSLSHVDFPAVDVRRSDKKSVKLSDLPGFALARPWVAALKSDLRDWRAGNLDWKDVDHGAVLSGAPGTGKTFFATALAAELGIPLVATSVAAWQASGDGYLGDMLKAMRASFTEARSKKCAVLFIDELDGIGRRGSRGRNAYYQSNVVNAFLELTDGLVDIEGVILLGATNRLEDIDPAVLRSGRFEEHFHFELPDEEERAAILCHHVSQAIDVPEARGVTDGLRTATPADLQKLARKAKRSARSRGGTVTLEDLRTGLPARTKLPEAAVLRIAVHECGHVIVALASKLVDELVVELEDSVLEERADLQEGGRVHYQMTETVLPTEATLLARIRIALAGMAAEEVVQGSRSIGGAGASGSDLDIATQIASQMVLSYGMGKSLRFHVDRQRISTGFMPPPEFHAEISGILSKEYRAARELLSKERATLMRMAAELVVDRRMEIKREAMPH